VRLRRDNKVKVKRLVQLTTPLLLHKLCNRFASVARVCQLSTAGRSCICWPVSLRISEMVQDRTKVAVND